MRTYEITISNTIYSKVKVDADCLHDAKQMVKARELEDLPEGLCGELWNASMNGDITVYYDVHDGKEVAV